MKNLWFNLGISIAAGNLFVVYRFFGTMDYYDPGIIITPVHLAISFIQGTGAGFVNGIAITFIDRLVDTEAFKKRSFRYTLIFKSAAYCVSIIFCVALIFILDYLLDEKTSSGSQMDPAVGTALTLQYLVAVFIYMMFLNVSINFLKEANKKFGPGILFKLFSGKYYQPVVEERIFMFIDLKASTTIAERLGHLKYSRLIQDCFYEITDIVDKFKAEIYQYVGDEIVLSWEMDTGIENNNCFCLYFAFRKKLEENRGYYQQKYDLLPEFKAGMNCGTVTVCEVGEIKKDIAYHGDVLNTASRIQGLCNIYNKEVLISESLNKAMPKERSFIRELIGEISLKGKETVVGVYSLESV
ncbi:MAG TPA: adenylate/guanylate cyclase domain-containing protein [Ignavibacteria bacterium]|nr:adenylate/guanylate cyclase domain-containing protein [Ignavibacteria bacterium]